MTKLAMKRGDTPLFIAGFFFYNKGGDRLSHKREIALIYYGKKGKNAGSYFGKNHSLCTGWNCFHVVDSDSDSGSKFTSDKKIRKGMEDTLEKAQAYFNCILEEEKPKENDLVEEAEQKLEKTAEKAEDAALLQDVLLEYFS